MKQKLLKSMRVLLVAAGLCVGANAWADDTEVTLNCNSSIVVVGSNYYQTTGYDWSSTIYLNSYAGNGGAGGFSFVLDNDWNASKVKSAVLQIYTISNANKNRTGEIYIRQLDAYPTPSETSTSHSGGKHIEYNGGTGKRYTYGVATKLATISGSVYGTGTPPVGSYYDIDLSNYFKGLSSKNAGDELFFGIDISDWAASITLGAYGNTYAPKLVITYTSETLYNVTFAETNGVDATIKIDGADVTSGTSLPAGSYNFTATAEGYEDYNGSFTLTDAAKEVSFTMTAKVPVTSITVNYTYNDEVVFSEPQTNLTGLYVGESYDIPFRMYVTKDGALYRTTANSSNPNYGETVTLAATNTVTKALTAIDLNGGKIELFEDLDNTNGQNAGIRASYCSAYDNKAYTSAEDLPAGVYNFYLRVQNQGRGSSIKIGETEIYAVSALGKGSWNNVELTDITVPTSGKLTIAAGGSGTRDDYDVIIAISKPVPATITSAGWATLYTPYALDFSGVTGLDAYTATCSESTVTLTKVNNVPANTGVVLKGAADTYNIPVIASSTTDKGHLLGSATTATAYDTYDGYTLYMLKKVGEDVQFVPVTSGNIAAGKAFLKIASGSSSLARSLNVVFADEATGISAVQGEAVTTDGYYNLSGQRISQPTKGLYIVNGKKVVIK
ncbi:MAG: hypothetical protein J6Z14_00460 [Prevotella sp.]|nr:hypothetical protein [Prevotella sp.]